MYIKTSHLGGRLTHWKTSNRTKQKILIQLENTWMPYGDVIVYGDYTNNLAAQTLYYNVCHSSFKFVHAMAL